MTMALQLPHSEAETGKTGLPLIAEAMARGLSFAHEGIANTRNLRQIREHLAMRDWIRDSMDSAHREGIFGQFLKLYEEALVRHSEPAVLEAIDDVPAASLVSLYLSLSENGGRSAPLNPAEQMLVLGEAMGLGTRQLSLGAIYFGAERGLFPGSDFGLTPGLKAQAGRLGPGPGDNFALVDANYFEMLRQFQAVPKVVESDWGSLHPLVRGFAEHYDQDPWVRAQGVERIQQAVGEVEGFVTGPRH